jgi:glycosyltransferase involved in cell wall biosynthesis
LIKILYIVSRLREGGPSNQLWYIINNLDDTVFSATILTLSPEDSQSTMSRFEQQEIPVRSMNMGRMEGILRGGSTLKEIIQNIEPDLVHTQGWRPDLLSAWHVDRFPRVATIRNYPWDDYPMKFGRLRGTLMAWTHLNALRRIDHPVACSEAISILVQTKGIHARAIRNGVDISRYYPSKSGTERNRMRKELGLPAESVIYISVGSLIQRKDPVTVIQGFLKHSTSQKDVLIMLGDGPLMQSCKELAAQASDGAVRLEGQVSNVAEYLRAANYFISASHSEGLPNTVMEALASGLPVILSDIAAHREFFAEGKTIGELFPSGDPSALAQAIDDVEKLDDTRLAEEARKQAVEHLSAEAMSREYQNLYHSIVEN